MSEQLKPCPFCGCENVALWMNHRVLCPRCDAEGPSSSDDGPVNLAAWNRRSLAGAAEPVAWQVRRIDPEEGPSIWMSAHRLDLEGYRNRPEMYELRPLYDAPQPSPEQAAPRQAPLTDEQIDALWLLPIQHEKTGTDWRRDFVRSIERAHGITTP